MIAPPLVRPSSLAGHPLLHLGPDALPAAALVLVDLSEPADEEAVRAAAATSRLLVGLAPGGVHPGARDLARALTTTLVGCRPQTRAEVQVDDPRSSAAQLAERAALAPRAASVLVDLLRLTARLEVREGLLAESLAYSLLLAGPEFHAWRRGRPRREIPPDPGPPVRLRREGDVLHVVLDRAHRHNAYGRELRDALVEALHLPLLDPSLRVQLSGAGPSFCSGGDLDEFGSNADLVAAHLVRTGRSAGLLLDACRDRVEVRLHGACIGAGLELPAFAGRVVAEPDAHLRLPELEMGLVPGAGGTVSCTRRAGRWRTAYLVLSGEPVPVPTALEWGLVDDVAPTAAGR